MIDITAYGDVWAIEPDRAMALLSYIHKLGADIPRIHEAAYGELIKAKMAVGSAGVGDRVGSKDNVAIVSIVGTMMKQASSFSDGASTVLARRQVRNAANDPKIDAIVLFIDSPGGTVAGTQDLANDVNAAKKRKPVYTYFEDLGASAAYWVGAQGDKVYAANQTTLVGSIGAFFGIYDLSKWAEANGIKPILFTTGKYKTIMPGQEVNQEQIDYLQSRVEQMQSQFNEAVATARKFTAAELKQVNEGKVYLAEEAVKLKLVDGIKTLDEVVAEAEAARSPGNRGTTGKAAAMPRENAATLPALKAALPGASAEFVMGQLEKEATVAEAVSVFVEHEKATLKAKTEELSAREKGLDERKAKLDEREKSLDEREAGLKALANGARPLANGGSPDDDGRPGGAEAKVQELTRQKMKDDPKLTEAAARHLVLRDNLELRQQLVTEANGKRQHHNPLLVG